MDAIKNLSKLLKKGEISTELEFQRATMLDRTLKLMSKENSSIREQRGKLRQLLVDYEAKHWNDGEPSDEKVAQSDLATSIAETEHAFKLARKRIIKEKLKENGLKQKDLLMLLGHANESYISELINGINPMTLSDVAVLHLLLGIELEDLVPTILDLKVLRRLSGVKHKMNSPKLEERIGELVEA
ncbi:helix-turn-helix domain-containing protein [Pedobacter kyonggii]|uniref:XRE family transcriptional regulator n=1 Tax=Pedobacter kyonggii TaxID=1926871 RepID=A0A4Q9HAR1_9SPHI|nr:helix-turn-helix transcriptional regulator [Pedobacter kyonggii]TBO41191.1 XRE family transcriptional regulator [Pedobacter kyonggii]